MADNRTRELSSPITELGIDTTKVLLRFLDTQSLCRLSKVSKKWRSLINQEEVWAHLEPSALIKFYENANLEIENYIDIIIATPHLYQHFDEEVAEHFLNILEKDNKVETIKKLLSKPEFVKHVHPYTLNKIICDYKLDELAVVTSCIIERLNKEDTIELFASQLYKKVSKKPLNIHFKFTDEALKLAKENIEVFKFILNSEDLLNLLLHTSTFASVFNLENHVLNHPKELNQILLDLKVPLNFHDGNQRKWNLALHDAFFTLIDARRIDRTNDDYIELASTILKLITHPGLKNKILNSGDNLNLSVEQKQKLLNQNSDAVENNQPRPM